MVIVVCSVGDAVEVHFLLSSSGSVAGRCCTSHVPAVAFQRTAINSVVLEYCLVGFHLFHRPVPYAFLIVIGSSNLSAV